MCDDLLFDTLQGKIHLDSLLKWLMNEDIKDKDGLNVNKYSQSDFILYFLNYIHDTQTFGDDSELLAAKKSDRFQCNPAEVGFTRKQAVCENGKKQNLDEFSPSIGVITSTPNVKIKLNESYTSPLSPLYSKNVTPKVHKTTPTLCLGDFIAIKPPSKKKAQRNLNENVYSLENSNNNNNKNCSTLKARRINPTNLIEKSSVHFTTKSNSFTFNRDEIIDTSNGKRSFLLEERVKIMSKKDSFDDVPPLLTKTLVVARRNEINPLLKLVTFQRQLDVLISIYCFMLDNNYVLNLSSELYFLISLLLSRDYEESDNELELGYGLGVKPLIHDSNFTNVALLGNIHNRTYFAVRTLENQLKILKNLDKPTLRLLMDNFRLSKFSATCCRKLQFIYGEKSEQPILECDQMQQANVCFISDTDNKDNFPDAPSFHAFKKQRDLFYDILRIWEDNRLQDHWNFTVALGGKIKALLNMHLEAANLVHFARLFKAQLLMNVSRKNAEDGVVDGNQFFSSLPYVDAEKLLKLKNRIVSKPTTSGINSVPTFNGYQEFYSNFLLVAANHVFNRHLIDALVSEIVDLNNTKFSIDIDDNEEFMGPATRSSYSHCLKSLRIYAKFLGFLESMPYKSNCSSLPQNVVSNQMQIRNQVQPSLNLKALLRISIENNHLILTIPWITKYLAMLDYVTLRLTHFQSIFHTLFQIYVNTNIFLIKLCLGWLFGLPNFPEDLYYCWLSQKITLCEEKRPKRISNGLDDLNGVVDQNILYCCCPYLHEIRSVLSNNASTLNNSVKHITPLTTIQSPTDLSSKRLKLELEEVFLNGQPVSIRKTIEFISERVASAFVKEICNKIVPSHKKKATTDLRAILGKIRDVNDQPTKFKLGNMKANKLIVGLLKSLHEQINNELEAFMSQRIENSIDVLLAADVSQQSKEVCVMISMRTCKERVELWINSHVNKGVFMKDFDSEIRQWAMNSNKNVALKPLFALPEFGKDILHNPNALSGVETVELVRTCMWKILEDRESVSINEVTDLLNSVNESVNERCDLNDCILLSICYLLVDLSLLLVAHRPDILSEDDVLNGLCSTWIQTLFVRDLFKHVLSPRNLILLSLSPNIEWTWRVFGKLISMLLNEDLMKCKAFEQQVLAFNIKNVDKETFKHVSAMLQAVVSNHTESGCCQTDFARLLNFLNNL